MKRIYTSIRRLKEHELRCTLRYIRESGEDWHNIFVRLGEIQRQASQRFARITITPIIAFLILNSFGDANTVDITMSTFSLTIPSSYVSLIASATLFFSLMSLQNVLMISNVRARESVRIRLLGFNSNAYGLYFGQDDMALPTPVLLNPFLEDALKISRILSILVVLVVVSAIAPLLGIMFFLFKTQLEILTTSPIIGQHFLIAIVGIFCLGAGLLYVILFNFPLPFKKRRVATN